MTWLSTVRRTEVGELRAEASPAVPPWVSNHRQRQSRGSGLQGLPSSPATARDTPRKPRCRAERAISEEGAATVPLSTWSLVASPGEPGRARTRCLRPGVFSSWSVSDEGLRAWRKEVASMRHRINDIIDADADSQIRKPGGISWIIRPLP